ncbi:hypothetical protein IGJ55_000745 [Enterococcus sp. AZ170]|uniref:CHAP domain-containing protein n=1 Tax=unclassified Enterococcus TaxID=2608891 RepID=UPI003D28B692
MVRVLEVVSYTESLVGKSVDEDGAYGSQCMDLTVHIMKRYFGWHPYGNAIELTSQNLPNSFSRVRVTSADQIKTGDILIWGLGEFATYGHTAIAIEDGSSNGTFVSIDQNWLNPSLTVGSPAARIRHNMHGVWGVIRPNYEQENMNETKKGEVTMQCFYKVDNKAQIYYFDGQKVRRVGAPDEKKVLNDIYRANNGRDIPEFNWNSSGPMYARLLAVINRETI